MMDGGKNYIVGVFDDDNTLLNAVGKVKGSGIKIDECYTPFPVHGLEHALGYKPTRLPIVAFLFAMTGMILALTMQTYMLTFDWPMVIGGKPHFPFPSFVPVTFELSVLLAAFGMAGTFFVRSDLKPYKLYPRQYDERATDNMHVMAIDVDLNKESIDSIRAVLKEAGAVEVNLKDFDD